MKWVDAFETQLDALKLVDQFIDMATPEVIREMKSWRVDRKLLEAASPFAWSADVIKAVLEAGKSIPLDTELNVWNLTTSVAWWYFEEPLPFQTVHEEHLGVRALCFGCLPRKEPGTFGLPVCCWIDEDNLQLAARYKSRVMPSQTFEWSSEHLTLGGLLEETLKEHRKIYGPGGHHHHDPQVGERAFMEATEGCARFILAGLAWLNQKVVAQTHEHIERHRGKEFARLTLRERPTSIKVVQLRRVERAPSEGEGAGREYSCQWIVGGHWRNQAYGHKMAERRLTWINPYIKGPDDKPLKVAPATVYEVSR